MPAFIGADFDTFEFASDNGPLVFATPTGVVAGDLMFVYVTAFCDVPSGWTAHGVAGPDGSAQGFYRVAGASEPATHEFFFWNTAISGYMTGGLAAWHVDASAVNLIQNNTSSTTQPRDVDYALLFALNAEVNITAILLVNEDEADGTIPTITWDADVTVRASHTTDDPGDDRIGVRLEFADIEGNIGDHYPALDNVVNGGTGATLTVRSFRTGDGLFLVPAVDSYVGMLGAPL